MGMLGPEGLALLPLLLVKQNDSGLKRTLYKCHNLLDWSKFRDTKHKWSISFGKH